MIVTSKGMLNIKGLSAMLGEPIFYYLDPRAKFSKQRHVGGWGRKKSFKRAQQYALEHQKKLVCLEDGFIRSLGLGKDGVQPLSIVVDYTGIYFDSQHSSDLEILITQPENTQDNQRALHLISKIKQHSISKYNEIYTPIEFSKFQYQKNILVIDQTFGDQSIAYAGASASTFKLMLKQALLEHPDATVWVKIHPDVQAGHAKSHFSSEDLQDPRIKLCTESYNPIELLRCMEQVYVVSSQLGFEAIMCGIKVSCFGLPWYAGWGVTDDRHAPIHFLQGRRGIARSVEHLFVCAYLKYARYVSPISHQICQLEEIIDLLIVNKCFQNHFVGQRTAYGFSRWKKPFIREFLNFPKTELKFQNLFQPIKEHSVIAWGKKARKLQSNQYKNIITVEDGFVRSHGLGANLIRPYSLVFDDLGIYYDATRASRLECLLNKIALNDNEKLRSKHLIQKLINKNITKYNIGDINKLHRPVAGRVLLVVGQVEDDMSVQFGGTNIKDNRTLLKRVRCDNPEAYIIYKPHPDVYAGLRRGHIEDETVLKYANQIELKSSILECFEICDELHTISSLSGFEALLRGLKVCCYGLPFYAGWGLTYDLDDCPRRQKSLSIEELVFGVLIQYAMYNLPQTAKFGVALVNVEDVIDHIVEEKNSGLSSPVLKSTFAKLRAKIL